MKKLYYVIWLLLVFTSGCRCGRGSHPPVGESGNYSATIPIDTANRMIDSYLKSIQSNINTDEIKSLTFDADSMRTYLADPKIKQIKFFLAHDQAYAYSKKFGVPPDSNSHVLRLIMVGFDETGTYIYKNNGVYDNMNPCPSDCAFGPAGGDYLTQ